AASVAPNLPISCKSTTREQWVIFSRAALGLAAAGLPLPTGTTRHHAGTGKECQTWQSVLSVYLAPSPTSRNGAPRLRLSRELSLRTAAVVREARQTLLGRG